VISPKRSPLGVKTVSASRLNAVPGTLIEKTIPSKEAGGPPENVAVTPSTRPARCTTKLTTASVKPTPGEMSALIANVAGLVSGLIVALTEMPTAPIVPAGVIPMSSEPAPDCNEIVAPPKVRLSRSVKVKLVLNGIGPPENANVLVRTQALTVTQSYQ